MDIALNDFSRVYSAPDEILGNSGKSYELGDRIGGGGNGAVYECIDINGNILAVKFLLHFSDKIKKRFLQEVTVLKAVNHPHIIKYYDDGKVIAYDKKRNPHELYFVIMEKADCNLVEYLRKEISVEYDVYSGQFRGLCEALAELHKYAIHRDIKPENILVKGEKWVLSDFGLCQAVLPENRIDVTEENEKVGPAFWMSPEAITKYYLGTSEINASSDVFQLCMVFIFVLTREFPGGIIQEADIENTTQPIKELLLSAVSHKSTNRPNDGAVLLQLYNNATYYQPQNL